MVSFSILIAEPSPEVNAPVVLRQVSGPGSALCHVFATPGEYFEVRPNPIPVASLPYQLQREPVIVVLRGVVEHSGGRAQIYQEGIELAIIVVIGKASAPR